LKLSACLERWKINVESGDVDEFVMKVANSVMGECKLDKLSLMGNRSPYTVVFRQAKKWDDIIQGHHYADPKTLIEDAPCSRSYKLPSWSGRQYSALSGSVRGSRVLEARE
jgi:hypothetical protein